jgi:hypothetical protein
MGSVEYFKQQAFGSQGQNVHMIHYRATGQVLRVPDDSRFKSEDPFLTSRGLNNFARMGVHREEANLTATGFNRVGAEPVHPGMVPGKVLELGSEFGDLWKEVGLLRRHTAVSSV